VYLVYLVPQEKDEKDQTLKIRCSIKSRQRFRSFWVKYGFKDMEEALSELLRIAEEDPKLVRGRIRRV